jgi:hypothetical protein
LEGNESSQGAPTSGSEIEPPTTSLQKYREKPSGKNHEPKDDQHITSEKGYTHTLWNISTGPGTESAGPLTSATKLAGKTKSSIFKKKD